MKNYIILSVALLIIGCTKKNKSAEKQQNLVSNKTENTDSTVKKIPVLNFGTFHMGYTTDENTTNFDEHNKENQKKVHEIAKKLAAFDPTVIIVEKQPKYNEKLQNEYEQYINDKNIVFKHPNEVQLLAYEIGRICKTKRIYGIDHKMSYNYNIGGEIENTIDSTLYNRYYKNPLKFHTNLEYDENKLSLLDNLKMVNSDNLLNFLITVNADGLTYAGTDGNFEGADEATKYYQRNLRMYSNLNRIELDEHDRVFILMGASHTAFFRDFINRSPKYKMVNTFDYLK